MISLDSITRSALANKMLNWTVRKCIYVSHLLDVLAPFGDDISERLQGTLGHLWWSLEGCSFWQHHDSFLYASCLTSSSLCHLVESLAVCYFAISITEWRGQVSCHFYFQPNNSLIQGNFPFFGPIIALFSLTNISIFFKCSSHSESLSLHSV